MSDLLTLPVLPLRDVVLFPGLTVPIVAGRTMTLRALEAAQKEDPPMVLAMAQRENQDDVSPEGLFTLGTVARIEQIQRSLTGVQVLIHGVKRGMAMRYRQAARGFLEATVRETEVMPPVQPDDPAFVALYREARRRATELGHKSGHGRDALQQVFGAVEDPNNFADLISGFLDISLAERQSLLETLPVEERLRRVLIHIQRQIEVADAQQDLQSKVQEELGDRQREIYLREQLKKIQQELGDDDETSELEELGQKLEALELSEAARKEVDRELRRLTRTHRDSMESQVIRTFLETVTELPWSTLSEDQLDLKGAAQILDEDHYGLEDVKDRVLEFLAVHQLRRKQAAAASETDPTPEEPAISEADEIESLIERLAGDGGDQDVVGAPKVGEPEPFENGAESAGELEGADPAAADPEAADPEADGTPAPDGAAQAPTKKPSTTRAPILLFVGPPGVGKTSLAKSIARAMGREYVRVSLGGARDEAEIRGHRRTYVGAMPGRIIQGMKQAGTKNPVFLLDEIDKLGASFQGDPGAALLEVLDPAQNDTFTDHYMGIPFDLSEVLFVCTANFVQNIPGPLLDRMELIEFDGYTEREKLAISEQFLVPRQLEQNGLHEDRTRLAAETLSLVISEYTREAGVRQLEREIGRLLRKVARKVASGEIESIEVLPESVRGLLGRPKVHPEKMAQHDQVGVATGMYYTPTGGDIMFVEVSRMSGDGKLVLTGQLGDVMKESAQAAWSYARSHSEALHIDPDGFKCDIHVHAPAGAIPKDGPSAGITMATALVSSFSGRPVRHDLAMTGEVTLTGRVLPIGGVKEKILGGVRAGIRAFVIPEENEADLEDLPDEVRREIVVTPVSELGEVLALALRDATFKEGRLLFGDQRPEDVRPLSAFEN